MTDKEQKVLKRIPKKYRQFIKEIIIEDSMDYNERGQLLFNYNVVWNNGNEHTYQNQSFMIWKIQEDAEENGDMLY